MLAGAGVEGLLALVTDSRGGGSCGRGSKGGSTRIEGVTENGVLGVPLRELRDETPGVWYLARRVAEKYAVYDGLEAVLIEAMHENKAEKFTSVDIRLASNNVALVREDGGGQVIGEVISSDTDVVDVGR